MEFQSNEKSAFALEELQAELEEKGYHQYLHFYVYHGFDFTGKIKNGIKALDEYLKSNTDAKSFSISGYGVWEGEEKDNATFCYEFKREGEDFAIRKLTVDYKHPRSARPYFNQIKQHPSLQAIPKVDDIRKTLKTFSLFPKNQAEKADRKSFKRKL